MNPLSPVPSPLSPAEATAMRRAFGSDREREACGDGKREVATSGDSVVLRYGRGKEAQVAKVTVEDGPPCCPTISADGSRLAYVRRPPGGGGHLETMRADTGPLGNVERKLSWHSLTTTYPIAAVDLSEDGRSMAYVSPTRITVAPVPGIEGAERSVTMPEMDGIPTRASDVDFLPGGRVAVETDAGTYLLLDSEGTVSPVSLGSFDRERFETRCHETRQAHPSLTGEEATRLADRYGTALAGAWPSPDGGRLLLQVEQPDHSRRNLLLERATGHQHDLGPSQVPDASDPSTTPSWSEDGRFVTVEGKRLIPVAHLTSGWDVDLGTGTHAEREKDAGQVIREEEAVIIGGLRVPRRKDAE